jgi:outer membrane protein assembly factor BamB
MYMKTSSKLFLLLFLLLFVVSFFVLKFRGEFDPYNILNKIQYYEIRATLFGDKQEELITLRVLNKEDRVTFPAIEKGPEYFREKWKFRGVSTSQNTGIPLVEDVDKDGIPDVFIGSETTRIYRLNGITGEKVWEYILPFGVASNISYFLADLDDDGMKEYVFGTTMSSPLRLYALRTGKNEKSRAFWARSVGGDFFQGGLNFFRTSNGEIRIVTATRDAPYARGSVNILDGRGSLVVPELSGFDVCNNRPAFIDVNEDGELDVLIGSHGFYDAKYANSLTAIDSVTGNIVWSTNIGSDTGWVNFQILDIDGDGEKEIMVPALPRTERHSPNSNLLIYSRKGHKKEGIKSVAVSQAIFPNSDGDVTLLYSDSTDSGYDANLKAKVFSQNLKTREINYELPLIAFNIISVLDLDNDSIPELLVTLKIDSVLSVLLFNAYTGKLKSIYQLNSKKEVKSKYRESELSILLKEKIKEGLPEKENILFLQTLDSISLLTGLFNLSLPEPFKNAIQKVLYEKVSQGVRSGALVDLDGDRYWELLGMENSFTQLTTIKTMKASDSQKGYYTAYDLPFTVLKGFDTNKVHSAFMTNLFKSRGE